jgi:acetylornithine deacetylase/succinyl-diaminopimelate desuccinylase-like protein
MEMVSRWALVLLLALPAAAQDAARLRERARDFLIELIRRDTTNPPGNETRAARFLKEVADSYGIPAELLGDNPDRLNFVARIAGSGKQRPLLLMAHTDVVPADLGEWTADPFAGEVRDGMIYGRGAVDDKNLLAAELAVMVELKVRGLRPERDIILLAEADEEEGSTGIQWMIANAWDRIDAEAALNESGYIRDYASKRRAYHLQTAEKIPTRLTLRARGTAGHGSLPRPDNAILRLSRALLRLDVDQPVRLDPTTRRYLSEIAKLDEYRWIGPLVRRLEHPASQMEAAALIRSREPEFDALLRTTIAPTMLRAGIKINVIPNTAEAQLDVRRLPDETPEEVLARVRRFVHDPAVEVRMAEGQVMPATEPSPVATPVYRTVERVLRSSAPRAAVLPFMSRGASDAAFLRQKGMPVYGVPLFHRDGAESRAHGNDERISLENLGFGTELLWKIVLALGSLRP